MTPNTKFYPALPAQPGWPGLMLRLDNELEGEWGPEGGTDFRVVVRKDPRFIEYLGQYEMMRLGDITGGEWKRQPSEVKERWTNIVGGGQSWHDAIVRIALRKKLGCEPSIEEFRKYTQKLTADNYSTLAKELMGDVNQAFCKGQEAITVWGMKCVGYDYEFERHLAASLQGISSSSGPSKKRKGVARDNDATNGDQDRRKEVDSEFHAPPPSKRQRMAKGKAKHIRYDWSDATYHDDSRDDDYKPATN